MSEPASPAKDATRAAFTRYLEMKHDIVAELDRWLDNGNDTEMIARRLVVRARDEIVELRKYWNGKGRHEVLEEAARACDGAVEADPLYAVYYKACAAAIRALKNKP